MSAVDNDYKLQQLLMVRKAVLEKEGHHLVNPSVQNCDEMLMKTFGQDPLHRVLYLRRKHFIVINKNTVFISLQY